MKKLILIIILLPSLLFGQNIDQLKGKKINDLSDTELITYWKQAKDNGYSLDQIKTLARAQGVSEAEISQFEKRISKITENTTNEDEIIELDSSSLTSIFGKNNAEKEVKKASDITVAKLPIFGSDFFKNTNISSAPQLNIATPDSYELGPGDELLISLWGAAENEYSTQISREGFIKVERIGPVYVSGLNISQAKIKLKRVLSKIYSGLNSSNESQFKVFLDVSLTTTRSIIINVTGNVNAPDTYTISSLASILNVLYAAGGPSDSGSYRNIKIIRNGKTIKNVDLYDYFSKGELESFSLRDQDIILVPNYENRVFVNGEFKNKGIFEIKRNENINDLLLFTGGISSFGFKDKLFIKRTDGINRRIEDVNIDKFMNFNLKDGDIIEARPVTDNYTNLVTIEGAISVEGDYSLTNVKNLDDLIVKAGGLKEYAIKERGYLIRKNNGIENEIISFDISNSKNLKLKPEDRVIISSKIDINRPKKVKIQGEVFEPRDYPFFDGMTLIDLILVSKGLTLKGDLNNIEIYRSTYDVTKKKPVEAYKVSLNSDLSKIDSTNNIKLKENDLVVIREKLGYQEKEFITVEGLVKYPGTYAIKNNNYSFYNLMQDFQGFLDDAALDGVKIIRQNTLNEVLDLDDSDEDKNSTNLLGISSKDSLNVKVEIKPFIEFGVDVNNIITSKGKDPKYNVVLKNGDKIIVPRLDNTIEVTGAVQQSSAVTYSKSLTTTEAINRAGGFGENAKKNSVYVVYQNGNVASTKSFLFFNNYPKLKPGAKIIVPEKTIIKNKTTVSEIVGYTTSLVSVFAIIKSL